MALHKATCLSSVIKTLSRSPRTISLINRASFNEIFLPSSTVSNRRLSKFDHRAKLDSSKVCNTCSASNYSPSIRCYSGLRRCSAETPYRELLQPSQVVSYTQERSLMKWKPTVAITEAAPVKVQPYLRLIRFDKPIGKFTGPRFKSGLHF